MAKTAYRRGGEKEGKIKVIPLIKPYITDEVKKKVLEVLESGYLTEGPVTKEFEEKVRDYVGARHAISVTSCTTGLELALRACNIGKGDEVICPDFTYPATADVIKIVGATPVIVDIDPRTMLIDIDSLKRAITSNTKAIMPVSLFGNPLDWDALYAIKDEYDLIIIEDAACSIGARYKDKPVGSLADISVFSFHPRKFITTGEGGMITTNNDEWANWMESYKHFGMDINSKGSLPRFKIIGTNYKLSNVLAAIGLVQMQKIDELLEKRRSLALNYIQLLQEIDEIKIPEVTQGGFHSYQSFCIFAPNRDEIIKKLKEQGMEAQIGTFALHLEPAFNSGTCILKGHFNGSEYAYKHCLTLPIFYDMTMEDQKYVVETLKILLSNN